jgi:hypothetical protein
MRVRVWETWNIPGGNLCRKRMMTRKPRKRNVKAANSTPTFVDFRFNEQDYKIDLDAKRVYRNWVSVEASRSFLIISAYRSEASATV